MFRTSLTTVLLALAAAASATPASAAPQGAPTRIVSYADLDLSTVAGRVRLERRIGAAVRVVCGRASPADLGGINEIRLCRTETLAQVAGDRRVGRVYLEQAAGGTQ